MKKLIALILVLCTLTLSLAGCGVGKIEVDDWVEQDWLYTPLKDGYEEGETVSVRIKKTDSTGCWIILDGKDYYDVVYPVSSTEKYWQFEFKMPSVKIHMELVVVSSEGAVIEAECAWVGYGSTAKLYSEAENSDELSVGNTQHLPIFKFDDLTEMTAFKSTFENSLAFDANHEEIASFNEAVAQYNDKFFQDYSLLAVYVSATSSSYRYGVNRIENDKKSVTVYIEKTNDPKNADDSMAGWMIIIPQLKSAVSDCETIDAQMTDN